MANFPLNFLSSSFLDRYQRNTCISEKIIPNDFRSPGQYSSYTFRCSLIIMKKPYYDKTCSANKTKPDRKLTQLNPGLTFEVYQSKLKIHFDTE